MQKYR